MTICTGLILAMKIDNIHDIIVITDSITAARKILESITNGHLLICDWCFRILKGSKMRSLDSNKDVVKSEV